MQKKKKKKKKKNIIEILKYKISFLSNRINEYEFLFLRYQCRVSIISNKKKMQVIGVNLIKILVFLREVTLSKLFAPLGKVSPLRGMN